MNKLTIMEMKSILISLFFTTVAAPLLAQSDTLKTHFPVADSITYTCPMHPEVISGQPGKCPKCGMDLVQKESSSTKHKMSMMMCPMHGMVGMDHKHNEEKGDHKKGMKSMWIIMWAMMVAMIVLIANR